MLRRWPILALLLVALGLLGARVRRPRPAATPRAPAQHTPSQHTPAAPTPAPPAPGGHGAHAGPIDWATISDRDLDVATVFLVARRDGVARALDTLRAMAADDPALALQGHVVTHALGRWAVARAKGDPAVYARCREDFQAGCWHGVMEGYLTSPRAAPPSAVAAAALDTLCATIAPAGPARLPRLECAHGMGHGLTARAGNDYRAALRQCDALSSAEARRECHDGVFMEVTVRGTEPRPGTNDAALLKRADLRWPCDAVGPAYATSCWAYQPIVIYEFTRDLARTAAACPPLPAASAEACARGLGKQLTGWAPNDSALLATCARAGAPLSGACVAGAAEGRIDDTWTPGDALALCRRAPAAAKRPCYATVGARMSLIHPRDEELVRDCAGAEPGFVAACVAGAARD